MKTLVSFLSWCSRWIIIGNIIKFKAIRKFINGSSNFNIFFVIILGFCHIIKLHFLWVGILHFFFVDNYCWFRFLMLPCRCRVITLININYIFILSFKFILFFKRLFQIHSQFFFIFKNVFIQYFFFHLDLFLL